jgi:hypothetical protein
MEIAELEKIWEEFNLIKFQNGILSESFFCWDKGTKVTDVLDWFNSNIPDVFYDNKFSEVLLEIIWEEFGDVPINNDDEIELDFYFWKKGTYRFEIWHWFDEKLPTGVAEYAM